MDKKTTSDRLKELSNIYGITQADICKKTGIKKAVMSMYFRGTRTPKQNILTLIANSYNVQEVWLMGYDVPMNKTDIDKDAEIDAEITNAPIELKEYMLKLANMNSENQKAVKDFIDFCLSKNN